MLLRKNPQSDQPITRIRPRRSRKLRAFFWTLTIVIVGIVGWIGVTGIIALNNIQAKNDSDGPSFFKFGEGVDPGSLVEGETRINTLLIGADNAAGLTDTIQIYSIDPLNKTVSIVSVPRDLYVNSPGGGKIKINSVYNKGAEICRVSGSCDPQVDHGAAALKKVLDEVLGIRVHYFARVDFQGFKSIVDSIGGVSIYVEKALSDTGYPCETDPSKPCGYFQPAGTYNMTGTQALRYARCRNGNCGSDFGRAARQQQVVEAIRQKVLSLGVIANPKKITDIITDLGNHFRTDMKIDEMAKLFDLIQSADKSKTKTAVIDNGLDGPLQSTTIGQYVLIPKAGIDDWSEVHRFTLAAMPEPYVVRENARIVIVDSSGKETGQDFGELLTSFGYNIVAIETGTVVADSQIWGKDGKPYTLTLLKKRTEAAARSQQPTTTEPEPDIVLVIGSDFVIK